MMKLKPCPFCGKNPISEHVDDVFSIRCNNPDCPVYVYAQSKIDLPVEAWNIRAENLKAVPPATAPDSVNHPSHYETNGIECIDAMTAAQGVDAVQDFCICNAFKYIWRHKHKNGAEDIKKAVWYLNKWLELELRRKNDDKGV